MYSKNKTINLVLIALMAAMTCVATMIIRVPSPTGGFIHLGDGFVLLCGILLGPLYGGFAAGIGSMFADLLSGYPQYAIATLFIKSLAAVLGGKLYSVLVSRKIMNSFAVVAAGIVGGLVVTVGYLTFESFLMGFPTALTGVPANLVQNAFGIIVSSLLMPFLIKVPYIREFINRQ